MVRLSAEGEEKLMQSLLATLRNQYTAAVAAFEQGDIEQVRRIGHSLRGNSGATYFGIEQVNEIGHMLNQSASLDDERLSMALVDFRTLVHDLEHGRFL